MQGPNRKDSDAPASISSTVTTTGPSITAPLPRNQNGNQNGNQIAQQNGLASARIMNLLNQLGDRLIRGEQERLAVRETLSVLENRTEQTERIFLTIQDKVSKTDSAEVSLLARQEKLEKLFVESAARLERAEALTEKIEEAIALQNRLARRLEKTAQDKARILSKIEHIEDDVGKTREALNSKALIALAEHVARDGWLPQTAAANDRLKATDQSWWKRPAKTQAGFAVSLLAAAVLGGIAMNQLATHWPQDGVEPPAIVAVSETPALNTATVSAPEQSATSTSTNKKDLAPYADDAMQTAMTDNPDAVAATLNDIEPGKGDATETADQVKAAPTPAAVPATQAPVTKPVIGNVPAEKSAVAKFPAPADNFDDVAFIKSQLDRSAPLADRIKPDPALPPVIKGVEDKAFQGVPEAQHDLAAIYTAGHAGVTVDFKRAAAWFAEAGANGVANARYNLGVLYHQGLGVDKNIDKAIGWYRAAAKLGHPEAEYNLGIAYIEGIGTQYNPRIAADYFVQAARGGVLEAAYNLGLIYENGLLGDPDMNEAVFWYKLSSDHSPEARVALTQAMKNLNLNDSDVARIVKEYSAVYKIGQNGIADPQPQKISPVKADAPVKPLTAADQSSPDDPAMIAKSIPQLSKEDSQNLLGSVHKDQAMIAQVQEQLSRLKIFNGAADGLGGPDTESAIRSYQKQSGLPVTGKPSEDLLVRLLASEINSSSRL